MAADSMAPIAHYECFSCVRRTPADDAPGVCPHCEGPLLVRFDMQALRHEARRPPSHHGPDHSMWRYRAILPEFEPLCLAEADTPMLRSRESPRLWLKLENRSAGGTGLVRGMGMAIAWHGGRGYKRLAVAADGAEAVAFAACAAAFGAEAHIFLPRGASFEVQVYCASFGAEITRVEGGLEACQTELRRHSGPNGWCDLTSPAHPMRIEGDKTLGFEIAEHFGWELPDAVICPPESALALAKAFAELDQLGWLQRATAPKLFVTKATHAPHIGRWAREAAERSQGSACDSSPSECAGVLAAWPRREGFLLSSDGAAAVAAWRELVAAGVLQQDQRVVVIDNGQVTASIADLSKALGIERPRDLPARMPVGGIITPQ